MLRMGQHFRVCLDKNMINDHDLTVIALYKLHFPKDYISF